jgi:uncharacterized repeat protein (TIGR02543 family)
VGIKVLSITGFSKKTFTGIKQLSKNYRFIARPALPFRNAKPEAKKIPISWLVVIALLAGICQTIFVPQVAIAGSVSFGTGGTVTVPYNEKFDPGTGAFNLEMWVKETTSRPAQYTAQYFTGTKIYDYNDRVNKASWGMGVSFDGNQFYIAPEVGKWPTPEAFLGGTDNGYADPLSSNTKTKSQVYATFVDLSWHHIAVSKTGVGGTLSMYLDGVRVLYKPNHNDTFSMNGGDIKIGGGKFVGQIGDVRLVKGQSLYSGPSITVPTSQITTTSQGAVASNVSLLLKAGGANCAVEDVSENHFPIVINGAICIAQAPNPDPQTITFNSLANKSATDDNFDVSAIASSGLAVAFTSATSSVCTVTTTGTIDILKGGTCTINADQAGGISGATSFAAAARVTQSFTVNKVSQSISFDLSGIGSKNIESADFSINASGGNSGNSVTFSSANANCTITGSTVNVVSAGNCVITADQVGDDIYSAATQVSQTFAISQLYTVTYNSGTLGTGSVPIQASEITGGTFAVASGSGLSRNSFTFNGWKDALNTTYAFNSIYTVASANVTLTAQWRQNSLYGISDSDLSVASTLGFTTGGVINRTISFDDGVSSAVVRVPFNAFTQNVDVTVQALTDPNFAKNKVDPSKSFPINLVVSWLAADGTVPTASNALTLTITNPSIKAGATAYQIIGDTVTTLGRATVDGQIIVSLTTDPVVAVTNDTAVTNTNFGTGVGTSVSTVETADVTSTKPPRFKPVFTIYSANSKFLLNTVAKSQLRNYAKKQTKNSSVTCIGYIYPDLEKSKSRKFAFAQANTVCNYLKSQNKSLKTSIEIQSAKVAPIAARGAKWETTSYRVDGVVAAKR